MMFGYLVDPINNVLDIAEQGLSLEAPTREQVVKLIDDGVTIAGIAAMFGTSIEVIEQLNNKE